MAETPDNAKDDETDARLRVHREAIDVLDREILARLNERAVHAKAIGDLKAGSGAPAYRPDREAQVLARLCEGNGGPLSDAAVIGIFRQVMSACLALEQRLRVAYLGPAGTFSHAAVGKHFGQFVDALPCASIDEIFRAGEAGRADYGVVPVENTLAGPIRESYDLLFEHDLKIVGETVRHILFALIAPPGTVAAKPGPCLRAWPCCFVRAWPAGWCVAQRWH